MTLKVHRPPRPPLHPDQGRAVEKGPVNWDILGDVELESSFGKELSPEWSGLILPLQLLQGLRQRRLCSQAMFAAFQELV